MEKAAGGFGLASKRVLITGGTGSFGRAATARLLKYDPAKVIILSRDELKQATMREEFPDERVRFFLGDVRDERRLQRAFRGVDVVLHAAALKRIDAIEQNPFEAVQTNVEGAMNVITAAIDNGVERVVALSTDKAAAPETTYGATKFTAERLFIDGNIYAGAQDTRFSVTRYGNVVGSRGSVVPLFKRQAENGGPLTITDERMTRFWMTLDEAVSLVLMAVHRMRGGEIFIPKLPSVRIPDVAEATGPGLDRETIGIRGSEKMHERLVTEDEARRTYDCGDYYVIEPDSRATPVGPPPGKRVGSGFEYTSDASDWWLGVDQIREAVG